VVIGRLPVPNFEQSSAFFRVRLKASNSLAQRSGLDPRSGSCAARSRSPRLSRTAFRHRLQAIGNNRQAASLAGVQVGRVQVLALILMGVLAALAAALSVAQSGAGIPNSGVGFELDVIAGVINGEAAIQGGRGTIGASILRVLLIGEIRNGLIIIGVNLYAQTILSGILVIFAVAVDKYITRRARDGRGLREERAAR
jgi:ribose/xylose/arabinose/galactoside ABC-type transport system permease subunit